jgi:hypothetical protein
MALLQTNPSPFVASGTGTNAPPQALELREVKPPLPLPGSLLPWLALAALAVALVLLSLALRRRRTASAAAPAPALPPHVRARQALRQALELIHQPRPFCDAVSGILRSYLEERFRFHAPDRTTEEFLDELQQSPLLSLTQKQRLGDFLARCDLVKFARFEPAESELRDLWETASRLVEETAYETPAEPAPSGQAVPEGASPPNAAA